MEELNSKILKMAGDGDKNAFKTIYDHYAPFVWRLLIRMTGDNETARELLQDTFVRIHSGLHKFKGDSTFSTWIYRIAHNSVLMNYRKNKNSKVHESFEDQIAGSFQADEYANKQLVSKVLSDLTVEDRFLLIAREVDCLSFEEIAQICGISAGTLRTRLHRLKDTIRNRFCETTVGKEAVA